MHAKVLSPLLSNRITPSQKFPQLCLRPQRHKLITHHRRCDLPLSIFDPRSVQFAERELEAGRIVEVRRDDHSLVALGFYEPALQRVDLFDLTPKSVTTLPTISEDFFMARVFEAWERRRRILPQTQNNTYRIVNGYADGLPSLFVDIFSECFVRIISTSAGSERLVPPLVEFLRRRGAEDVLLDTPSIDCDTRFSLITPTVAIPQVYVEGGVSHLWLKEDVRPPSTENGYLVNAAHRRTRRLMRDLSKGKRVLTINDRGGSASMNAVMTAKHVTVVHQDAALLEWARSNLVYNHSDSVFHSCETICCNPKDLQLRHQQDVVFIESHPHHLCTASQWKTLLQALTRNNIVGIGSVIVVAQEEAPLGIPDLVNRVGAAVDSSEVERGGIEAVKRRPLASLLRDTMEKSNYRLKFLRAFSVACDFPLLPQSESAAFSQVFYLEGSAILETFRQPASSGDSRVPSNQP